MADEEVLVTDGEDLQGAFAVGFDELVGEAVRLSGGVVAVEDDVVLAVEVGGGGELVEDVEGGADFGVAAEGGDGLVGGGVADVVDDEAVRGEEGGLAVGETAVGAVGPGVDEATDGEAVGGFPGEGGGGEGGVVEGV